MKNSVKNGLLFVLAAILGGVISLSLYQFGNKNNNFQHDGNTPGKLADYTIERITLPTFDFTEISEKINPTVVHIKTKIESVKNESLEGHPLYEFFGPKYYNYPRVGTGSGVIISDDGYIVTNNHVIEDADDIEITLHDKRIFDATVIGRDKNTDLAVLKIDEKDLPFLKYGNSDDLKVGEWVVAVGNPFNLTSTITAGIVSAKARNIGIIGRNSSIESFIQTDAAVNPGNSGGALVNVSGELIGINTAIASTSGQYMGYSFAIPSNIVIKVVEDILKYGKVQRGFLGVTINEVTQEIAQKNNMESIVGVNVSDVLKDGAADDAGIETGDIIISINKKEVNSVPELQEAVSLNRPGDQIEVKVIRNGEEKTFEVTLKDLDGNKEIITNESDKIEELLGATLEQIDIKDLKKLGLENGVLVSYVGPGKFKKAGIPKNFIITKIDKIKISTVEDVYRIIQKSKDGVLIEGIEPDGSKAYYGFGMN